MITPNTLLQNRYLIIEQIGQGGMGAVYKATDQRLGHTVALKETLVSSESLRKAFEREARLLASLRHPALPVVSDHFIEGNGQFLVMQFIPGDDLAALLTKRGGPFPVNQVLVWADKLLSALNYLHTQEPSIIHRDIKPQNLKLTSQDDIVLLDFGLAKSASQLPGASASSVAAFTPQYAPIEQIQGIGTDPRSDLYSLAATLYHLLTGSTPPDALTRAAAKMNGDPDPLRPAYELNPQIPSKVASLLTQAMALNREQRPSSAAAMRISLQDTAPISSPINSSGQKTVIAAPHTGQPSTAQPVQSSKTEAATSRAAPVIMAQPRSALNSTALALIPLAIAINIAGGQLVKALRLPIYLDSIGTVLAGALLGPWIGLITGLLSNIIWTLIGLDAYAYAFAPVAGVIGLLAGLAGRAGFFQRPSPRWLSAIIGGVFLFALTLFVMFFVNSSVDAEGNTVLPAAKDMIAQYPIVFVVATVVGLVAGYFVLQNAGYAGLAGLVTGVIAAIVSAPIATYLFGGVTGAGTDALVAAFRATGQSILASAFAQGTVSDPFDKMTSFMVVYLIIQSLPQRVLQRFPNARAAQVAAQATRPATSR